jgi:SAM-dependent methyltransferase
MDAPAPEFPHSLRASGFAEFERLSECCLCGSADIVPRFANGVWKCRRCAILFRNPRPTLRQIVGSYNAGMTYAAWQRESEIRNILWLKRLKVLLRHKTSGRLLDVGTGDGHFLDFARSSFDVDSTEISETGAHYARARGHAPLVGPLLGLTLPEQHYDVVTLWHVLEHLPYPGLAIARLLRLLKPDGILVIAVPNETAPLLRQRFARNEGEPLGRLLWGGEIHLTHFTPAVLRRFLARCGCPILEMGVDDVHVERTFADVAGYYASRVLQALIGKQFDKAMYVVCGRGTGAPDLHRDA